MCLVLNIGKNSLHVLRLHDLIMATIMAFPYLFVPALDVIRKSPSINKKLSCNCRKVGMVVLLHVLNRTWKVWRTALRLV